MCDNLMMSKYDMVGPLRNTVLCLFPNYFNDNDIALLC